MNWVDEWAKMEVISNWIGIGIIILGAIILFIAWLYNRN